MQVTLSHLLNFLTGTQSGGVWFAATGIVCCIVLMRVVPEMPGMPASHWLKVSSVSVLALGFLTISLARVWYALDTNRNGGIHLPPRGLEAALPLSGVILFLLGFALLAVQAIQYGIAWSRDELPLMHTRRKKRRRHVRPR